MKLDANITKKYGLTAEEAELSMSSYQPMELKAGSYFLKEDQVSDKIGFVQSGVLRTFFLDNDANEITTGFHTAGSLVISFDSFNNRVPSTENIIAITDSKLMYISYDKQQQLYKQIPVWNRICRDLADHLSQEMCARSVQFQTLTARQRYLQFCQENPDVIQQVPLKHIASYLGMDIATLSRIRKNI
jgi:CRP-like cAMP-binding protein